MLRFEELEGMTFKEVHDLVGGRWVLYPSDELSNEGDTDLLIVFENLPWRFATGIRSNDPKASPPLQLRISRIDPTQSVGASQLHDDLVPICVCMSPEVSTDKEWRDVVMGSIRTSEEYKQVHVMVSGETTVLHNGHGEISLTVADTITLYQQLGELNGLTYTGNCPECDILLEPSGYCLECDEYRDD
jgi:hypothetical protein